MPAPEPRPRWAVPVAIVASIVVVALVGLFIALHQVESDAEREAERPATVIDNPLAGAEQPSGVAAWPAGASAYTVVLATTRDEGGARAQATTAAGRGVPVGLLESGDYRSLPPGRWVLFTGRFETRDEAAAAVSRYTSAGFPRARVAFVSAQRASAPPSASGG